MFLVGTFGNIYANEIKFFISGVGELFPTLDFTKFFFTGVMVVGGIMFLYQVVRGRGWKMPTITMKKISSRDKEEIYKPLRRDVEELIKRVGMLGGVEGLSEQPLIFWKDTEGKVSKDFYSRLEDIFERRYKEYRDWLNASQNFVRYKIYFYVNEQLKELQKEYKALGVGDFEYRLYNNLILPVFHGDNLSLTWFKDHDPSLWEYLEKCPHSKDIRPLLEWLKQPNSCVKTLMKVQSDLIKLAESLKDELNRKIR